jgi:peptide/nickel transport system substrate-binding protein
MRTPEPARRIAPQVTRRELLKAGLTAGAMISLPPLVQPGLLWGGDTGQPKRGGILRVRGLDPPNFDPHLTTAGFTQSTASFVYSKLVPHKVGADIPPGTFIIEPDLAERWEELDDTTYVFHLRQGVKWHNKPPVNGRELVAEDVKFTYERVLTEKGSTNRYLLDSVDRLEVVDRYTVKFMLKEPYVWFISVLAYLTSMWIIAPEVVQQYGDLKRSETAIGTGPLHSGAL